MTVAVARYVAASTLLLMQSMGSYILSMFLFLSGNGSPGGRSYLGRLCLHPSARIQASFKGCLCNVRG